MRFFNVLCLSQSGKYGINIQLIKLMSLTAKSGFYPALSK